MQIQPHWRHTLLRTEETALKYETELKERNPDSGCPLCLFETKIKEYEHWVLMRNKFPYDRYFIKSDMLVTKRHISERQLSKEELAELFKLKTEVLFLDYDSLIEHFPSQKSIPEHLHYHLVQYKRSDGGPR